MTPLSSGTAAKLAVTIGFALSVAAAWRLYRDPAMGLLLDMARFCG